VLLTLGLRWQGIARAIDRFRPAAASRPAGPRAGFTAPFLIGATLFVLLVFAWQVSHPNHDNVLKDVYPLYYGAKAWLHGGDAYDLSAVAPPVADPTSPFYRAGNGYPLPAVLLMLPLTLLRPEVASYVWTGLLAAGLICSLRLARLFPWFVFYWPLWNGLRLQQYTVLIVIAQIVALWAYRERRPWLLAGCCAVIVTKPTHGVAFAVVLALLARNWRQQLLVVGTALGATLLLDPGWPAEWLAAVQRYQEVTQQPHAWVLGLFVVPLLLTRDVIGSAVVLEFLCFATPLNIAPYPASALPLSVLDDRRSKWLVCASWLWLVLAVYLDLLWVMALVLFLPLVVLSTLRWWERRSGARPVAASGNLQPEAAGATP
jgi:hypothetical protein